MPRANVPGEIVRRLCPDGHLGPVWRAAEQPYCPRCGMSPDVRPAAEGKAVYRDEGELPGKDFKP